MVTYCMVLYIYEMSRIDKSADTESWMVVARDWEEGPLNVFGVSCGGDENVLELDRGGGLHNIVSVLNTTESYTLKWLSLCYVNFTSVKKKMN